MQRDVTASVFLGDGRVGTLGYHLGNTWFDYEDLRPDHPVLGQAFERDPRRRRTASGSVPEWFAGLLPEVGSGLRELVARSLDKKRLHDFALICHVGDDLPGAVRVVPDEPLDDLPEQGSDGDKRQESGLRFSLAGVQPKFSMRYDGKALVLPARGEGGDWMVKLPDQRFPEVPANEFAMLKWAGLAGIDVPEARLESGDRLKNLPRGSVAASDVVLAVRRFDRVEGMRVHQEDFGQIREVSSEAKYDKTTYEGIGRVIARLCPPEDVVDYVRRLVAMVIMGNADAHLKNWTLRYPDTRLPRLSPAYDLVCVTAYPEPDSRLAFPLGGTTHSEGVTLEHFRRLATKFELGDEDIVSIVRDAVDALASSWPQLRRDWSVPEFVVDTVEKRLKTLPLLRK